MICPRRQSVDHTLSFSGGLGTATEGNCSKDQRCDVKALCRNGVCTGWGGRGRTECLQEPKGHRRDSVCEAADPDLQIGIATVRRSPLLGTPRNCQVELALNHKGRTMSTRFLSDWNPLCVPAQVTLENKETGHFYHYLKERISLFMRFMQQFKNIHFPSSPF